ncbi:MAG: transposase, partial [Verrucomicrobiales bacterium]|nr:transposase [Verrucomicrobiales bacterium]
HRITNAMSEGLNCAIQLLKSCAKGLPNFESLRARVLFFEGKLRKHTPFGQGKKTGDDDRREQHELRFHSLRHTARTWLEAAGQPKAAIDAIIGHEGDTGKIYTSVGEDALRSAAAALADRGK